MIIIRILAISLMHFLFKKVGRMDFLSSGVKGLKEEEEDIGQYVTNLPRLAFTVILFGGLSTSKSIFIRSSFGYVYLLVRFWNHS